MNTHESFNREEEGAQGSSDRTFGLVFAVFFAAVALLPLLRHHAARRWALAPCGLFLLASLVRPSVLSPLNRLWTLLGLALHRVVNPLILGALFYLVFTPFGVVMRLFGKEFLRLRFDPQASSYWLPRQPPGPPPESMSNQF